MGDVTALDRVLDQAGGFFMGDSPIHRAASAIAGHLEALGIDYAVAGALCLAAHGVVRTTEDVDILVTQQGLERFKQTWLGRGYVNLRPGGKAVRDAENGVKIDFLVAGDFPGDGKPKPVVFPDPKAVSVPSGSFRILPLARLIELKLASGMTAPHRLQDLADVLRLVQSAELARDFAGQLHPYVRDKYDEIWLAAQHDTDDY